MIQPEQAPNSQTAEQTFSNEVIDLPLLKKEVDALQIAILEQKTPWFRNVSVLISLVALLFSFGTTYVSYVRTESQDIQNERVELRGLLQRLANLPRDSVEITKKYQNDPGTIALLGGFLNQENSLLARQAAELIRKIPPEYVSATEYYAVGVALQNAYNMQGAMEFFGKAIDFSKDFNDRVAALRMRANLLFVTGQPDAGRVDYQRGLNVFSDLSGNYNEYIKETTHIWTELGWALSEAGIGAKDAALQHVASAENRLSRLMPSPAVDQIRSQVSQTKTMIAGGHELPIPSSGLPIAGQTSPSAGFQK